MTAHAGQHRPSEAIAPSATTQERHAQVLEALEKAIAATRPLAAAQSAARTEVFDEPSDECRPRDVHTPRDLPQSPYAPRLAPGLPSDQRSDGLQKFAPRRSSEAPMRLPGREPVRPALPRRAVMPAAPQWFDKSDADPARDDMIELLRHRQGPRPVRSMAMQREGERWLDRCGVALALKLLLLAGAAVLAGSVLVQFLPAQPGGRPSSISIPAPASQSVEKVAAVEPNAASQNIAERSAGVLTPKPVKTTAVSADADMAPLSASAAPQAGPAEPTTTGAAAAADRGRAPVADSASHRLGRAEIHGLIMRGIASLQSGDVAAARLLLRRAADAGDSHAAMVLGASYDPGVLKEIGSLGAAGDVQEAVAWYRRSSQMGSAEGARRLQLLVRRSE